ncbi:hypothetical protein WG66_003099 [Moniliophthora roreri]|nr:hypothetical protein WG66_003099 [Moniliophthora roreri]
MRACTLAGGQSQAENAIAAGKSASGQRTLTTEALIVYLIVDSTIDPGGLGLLPFNIYVVVHQAAGIAPVLIMVRAHHGKSVDSAENIVSTICFADSGVLRPGAERSDIISHLNGSSDSGVPQSGGQEK